MKEKVILVDDNDKEIGVEEKMKAHENGGKRHRAFSVFVFNSEKETLLQKRADGKYHWGGVWSNTCCSHPRPEEEVEDAAHRRLQEELGFDCDLKEAFVFNYKAQFENGLWENEVDHVFVGRYEGEVKPNSKEVSDYKWIKVKELTKELEEKPSEYTPWLKIAFEKLIQKNNSGLGV